ncbi:hypothetical protein ACNOYE_01650 [Nannocystaceae bacterium ST9]
MAAPTVHLPNPLARDVAARSSPSEGPVWDRVFDLVSAVIGGVVLVLVLATFRDYGITWDETWHMTYGQHVIAWYSSGFVDDGAMTYRADYLYGGSFDGLGYLARQISTMGSYPTVHLFGALIGCVGLLGSWKLGRLLGGALGGLLTLTLLVLTPVWYGHMFNNPKDLPFAVGYVWALYYLIRVYRCLPAVPKAEWFKLSLALGAAMSVRIAGLLTVCYLFMILFLWGLARAREHRDLRLLPRYAWTLAPGYVGALVGGWALMLVFWPWAQLEPLRRPLIALARMSAFNLHERNMPFGEGRKVSTLTPPADYLLRYFGFKLPELTLALVTIAFIAFFVRLVRHRRKARAHQRALVGGGEPFELPADFLLERRRLAIGGLLIFVILFPPLYAIAKRSPLYDGLRHFLFLVPMMTVIAGVTAATILRWVGARSRVALGGLGTLVVVWAVRMVLVMIAIHPQQYLWFNQIIGGLPGAFLKYDTDYYGNTYKEGFELLRRRLWEDERERFLEKPYVVGACMPDFVADQYLGASFERKRKGGKSDFWLGYTRNNCYMQNEAAPEFDRVERDGTLLLLIRDIRAMPAKKAKPRKKAASKPKPNKSKPTNEAATEAKPSGAGAEPSKPTKTKPTGTKTKSGRSDPTGAGTRPSEPLGPGE